jgi:hypothetical protein
VRWTTIVYSLIRVRPSLEGSDSFFAFKGVLRGKLYLVDFIYEKVKLDKWLIAKTNID